MLKSFSSGVSDVRSMHYDSTETEDPLLGVVNHFHVTKVSDMNTLVDVFFNKKSLLLCFFFIVIPGPPEKTINVSH